MIPARARNASLASPEVGNTTATSGSSTTTALPAAYRDAYLLGLARLKSYSGRISSASVRPVALLFIACFFIVFSFTPCGTPRADDSNGLSPVHVHELQANACFAKGPATR